MTESIDMFNETLVTEHQRNQAEIAIKEKQKNSDFDIREFPVDVIVEKYTKNIPLIGNVPELYMPDYQREYKWSIKQQSEFIESVMIDLPIPYVYVADVSEGENEGRLEIIDGSQRIRTISRFLNNLFSLEQLTLLPELNGFKFKDLTGPRQLRFQRKTIRFIELLDVDEEARRQIFYRLNSGGTKLKDMEVRYGTNDGEFLEFIKELSNSPKFRTLCPISKSRINNREYAEMILRFFAYRFDMDSYIKKVNSFLTDFMDKMNGKYKYQDEEKILKFDKVLFEKTFTNMLDFVENHYGPLFFRKTTNNTSVPRIRFEALAVGTSFAIDSGEPLDLKNIPSWLESSVFSTLTDSDASNSIPKLKDRTFFVTNHLLNKAWEPTSTSFQKILDGKSPIPFLEQDADDAEAGIDGDQYVLF